MSPLSSATVFITGATSGFGAAAARRFAASGARLILCGRRTDRLAAMAAELQAPVHTLAFDIRDAAAIQAAIESLPAAFSAVDVLLNNAGLALALEPAQTSSLDDSQTMIDTNITGLVTCTRLLLPGMVERKRGHVINLGSVAGLYPYAGGAVYGGTKAFVDQFSMSLRCDLLGTGVRVTNILPGMCETEFSVVRFKGNQELADKVYRGMTPLSAEDIAETIHWVAALPPHVNINRLELMPVAQASAGFAVHRQT